MTYCKRFDNSCYHHQCIANRTAVILLQVLIGHSGEKRCKKWKTQKAVSVVTWWREAYAVTWLSWIRANGDGAWRHEWSVKPCYKLKMHRGIDGMFAFSSGLCSWINKDSRICSRCVHYLQSEILRRDSVYRPHLAARLATVTDGYVVLIFLLQLQARRYLAPLTKKQIYHNPQSTTKCVVYWL